MSDWVQKKVLIVLHAIPKVLVAVKMFLKLNPNFSHKSTNIFSLKNNHSFCCNEYKHICFLAAFILVAVPTIGTMVVCH